MSSVRDKPAVAPLVPVNPTRRPGARDEDARRQPGDHQQPEGEPSDDDKRERMPDNRSPDGKGRFVDEFA